MVQNSSNPNEPTEMSGTEARAGATPGVMRYVLLISLVLIIVAFAALLLLR